MDIFQNIQLTAFTVIKCLIGFSSSPLINKNTMKKTSVATLYHFSQIYYISPLCSHESSAFKFYSIYIHRLSDVPICNYIKEIQCMYNLM